MKIIEEAKGKVDCLSDEFFNKFFDYPYSKMGKNLQKMKTDIIETKDGYIINVDVPGYDKKDIKVHVGDKYLTIYVDKDDELQDAPKEGRYVYRERYLGTASRSFYIGNIKDDSIKANYRNGTLSLFFPRETKTEKDKTWIRID